MEARSTSSTASTSSTVAELVLERPSRARVFEQLGLDYCCGGKRSLDEACRRRGLDAPTVVALLDAAERGSVEPTKDWVEAPLGELCDHIVDRHHEYLRRELPRLSTLLEKVERAHGSDLPTAHDLRATFEQLRTALEQHLAEEEQVLFPAIRALDAGGELEPSFGAEVAASEAQHDSVGALLESLSYLTDRYDTSRALCNTHRATLDALRELELDLHRHVHEENNILFPRALARSASPSS
jgi:regulator of cell morphogenesis and NO signaling